MPPMTEADITAAVLQRQEEITSPRMREIMMSLVRHLHAFVREVELTEEEWLAGIKFLTETGQMCSDTRQEFILLSDTLGVSMVVDLLNHHKPAGATESTVLGPFFRAGTPELAYGASIVLQADGDPTMVSGRVLDASGRPIAGAVLDVWHASPKGLYDVQDPSQPAFNLRGRFRTASDGAYMFRTVRPVYYPVPTDGPVGKMLNLTGRHPYRPAHIHFIISAEGFTPLTTHLFDATDPYLTSDAVFAVKPSLICDFKRHEVVDGALAGQVSAPYYTLEYDFVLTRADAAAPEPAALTTNH